MAIVKMKKVTISAPLDERDSILDFLQNEGYIHFIDLKEENPQEDGIEYFSEAKTVLKTEVDFNSIKSTYEVLRRYNTEKQGMFSKKKIIDKREFDELESKVDWRSIAASTKEIEEKIGLNKNKRSKTISIIEQYKPWAPLDVSEEQLKQLRKTNYMIGSVSQRYEQQLIEELTSAYPDIVIERVSDKQQDVNLFILFHEDDLNGVSEILKRLGFTKASIEIDVTPGEKVKELNREIEELERENEELAKEMVKISSSLRDIERVYDYLSNKLQREKTIANLLKTRFTFILQGWIPEEKEKVLGNLMNKKCKDSWIEFEEPLEDEATPVALKNNALVEPFEIVTSMYSLPSSKEIDPTPVLAPFFLLFFGMMMSDIGYGLGMLIGSVILLKFMDLEGGAKKIAKLILYSSIPTIIFGALYGGIFGVSIKPLWMNPLDNPILILGISVVLGVVHLMVALGVKAFQQIKAGHFMDAVYDVGTMYAIIIGIIWSVAAGQGYVGGAGIAKIVAIVGVIGIFLTAGRDSESIGGKIGGGLFGVYGLTSYVGDALSYSRLMALGLATGLIGNAFNIMIGLMGEGFTIMKVVVGTVVLLAGHTFNLLINALGSYVHTSRLQYVEFFGKFYEGGGKAFEPLKINTKYIKVRTENKEEF